APAGEIPPSVRWSFYLGAIAFLGAVVWTVVKSKEYPPEQFERYAQNDGSSGINAAGSDYSERLAQQNGSKKMFLGAVLLVAGLAASFLIYELEYIAQLYIFSGGIALLGGVMIVAGLLQNRGRTQNGIVVVMTDFLTMPKT